MKLVYLMVVTVIAAGPLAVVAVASFRLWERRRQDAAARDRENLDYQHRRSREALDRHLTRLEGDLDQHHDK